MASMALSFALHVLSNFYSFLYRTVAHVHKHDMKCIKNNKLSHFNTRVIRDLVQINVMFSRHPDDYHKWCYYKSPVCTEV